MIFKTFKKLTRMSCPCMIVLAIVQDRVRPYIQPYMKSTSRVSSTVSISYINRMESCETVPKSYIQHPDKHSNVTRSPYDSHECTHGFIRSPYDQYGFIQSPYDQYGSSTNYTWSSTTRHGLYVSTKLVYELYIFVEQWQILMVNDNWRYYSNCKTMWIFIQVFLKKEVML